MWSVKHVDQFQPPPPDPDEDPDNPSAPFLHGVYDDERDVWVSASYPDSADFRSWRFELQNKAWGDAQVKLFLTCIRGTTEASNSHSHQVRIRNVFTAAPAVDVAHPWGNGRFYTDPTSYGECTSSPTVKEYFVAPGFKFSSANYRMVATYPWTQGRSWVWEFATDAPATPMPATVDVYGRCIERRVFDGATPRHALNMVHQPGIPLGTWATSNIPIGDPKERQYSCGQDDSDYNAYKAMVGWFYLDTNWFDNWYLGMEPRPKTRSFYFWNHAGTPALVRFGVLCINSRTGFPLP
jgi:hypothetical protein